MVLDERAGALFTWGTENKGMHSQEDIQRYNSMFNTLLFQYAQQRNLNLAELVQDKRMQDVFNRALIHTSLTDFKSVYERPLVVPADELNERAKDSPVINQLAGFRRTYEDASKRVRDLEPGKLVQIRIELITSN